MFVEQALLIVFVYFKGIFKLITFGVIKNSAQELSLSGPTNLTSKNQGLKSSSWLKAAAME